MSSYSSAWRIQRDSTRRVARGRRRSRIILVMRAIGKNRQSSPSAKKFNTKKVAGQHRRCPTQASKEPKRGAVTSNAPVKVNKRLSRRKSGETRRRQLQVKHQAKKTAPYSDIVRDNNSLNEGITIPTTPIRKISQLCLGKLSILLGQVERIDTI